MAVRWAVPRKLSLAKDFRSDLASVGSRLAFPRKFSLAKDFRSDLASVGSRLVFPRKLSLAIDFSFDLDWPSAGPFLVNFHLPKISDLI